MLKQFVLTEFNYVSNKSWLNQFEQAMATIDSDPQRALQILLDTDLERWYLICKQINDIEEVAKAIEFLSESLDNPDLINPDNDVSPCRSVLCFKSKSATYQNHDKIDLVIQVAKLASLPRRYDKATNKINALQNIVDQISKTQIIWKELIKNLNVNIKYATANKIKKNGWNLTKMRTQITEMYKEQREMTDRKTGLQAEIKVLTRVRGTFGPVLFINQYCL
jgi:hypothetical protein